METIEATTLDTFVLSIPILQNLTKKSFFQNIVIVFCISPRTDRIINQLTVVTKTKEEKEEDTIWDKGSNWAEDWWEMQPSPWVACISEDEVLRSLRHYT